GLCGAERRQVDAELFDQRVERVEQAVGGVLGGEVQPGAGRQGAGQGQLQGPVQQPEGGESAAGDGGDGEGQQSEDGRPGGGARGGGGGGAAAGGGGPRGRCADPWRASS